MATRTLPSKRDRYMTLLLTPFFSCSAKLPIYGYFANAFFPGKAGFVMVGLYVLGILMALIQAIIMKRSVFKGEAVPFVMELPDYRMPSAINVVRLLWEKSKDFITRAFSVILVATLVVWFLTHFDTHLNLVASSSESIMALVAGFFVPIFRPLGLGDWRIVTSLVSGFMAKESVVATLEVSFGTQIRSVMNEVSAAAMLVFSLLYTPCVAAIAAIRRELGNRWAIGVVVWQCVIAWIMAFLTKVIFGGF